MSQALADTRRAMEVCNACRYCETFCAVFPAMTLHREFAEGGSELPGQSVPFVPGLLLFLPVCAAA